MDKAFGKGVLLGTVLGAATAVGVALSKNGGQLGEELESAFEQVKRQVKKQLADVKDVTQEKYDEVVETAVGAYAEKKQLAKQAQRSLERKMRGLWKEFSA